MPIEISIWIGSENPNDPAMPERKANQFIEIAKHLNLMVIKDEREYYTYFYAVGNGIFLEAHCDQSHQDIVSHIEKELNPLSASVAHNADRPAQRDIHIDFYSDSEARQLPANIRWEMERSQACKCPNCGRNVALGNEVRWCPYCAYDLSKGKADDQLTVCIGCTEDSEKGSIYHHSYKHCPRCGKRLQRLRDLRWWDYNIKEQEFLGDGKPLSEFKIEPEHMPAPKDVS